MSSTTAVMMTNTKLQRDVKALQKEVADIKRYLEDAFLTPAEEKLVEKGFRELKAGKTISHDKLMKELGL